MTPTHVQFLNAKINCTQSHYAPGALRERHYHDSTWMVFTFSGSCALTMGSSRNLLTPRSLAYVPAGEAHANVFGAQGAGVFITAIDPAWIADRLENVRSEMDRPRVANPGLLQGLALKMYREFRSPDPLSDLIMEGAFLELLGCWFREKLYQGQTSPSWLRQVKALLQDSFRDPLSLDRVAQVAGAHPSHVAREFHRVYGMTIGEYIRKLRVEFVARHLLPRNDAVSLTDLALNAGFSSHAHMATVFKRTLGMTPSEYRKDHASYQSLDRRSIS